MGEKEGEKDEGEEKELGEVRDKDWGGVGLGGLEPRGRGVREEKGRVGNEMLKHNT